MKNIIVLLVLLSAQTTKVCSQPYKVDSNGKCRNETTEYLNGDLCCKRCPPGQVMVEECSETTDTVCGVCEKGLYMEKWNYAKNCLRCSICRRDKGLMYAKNCTTTTGSMCICEPGRYCFQGFNDPYCSECVNYKKCKTGYGVAVAGTATSNVKCKLCPNGTFSDTVSYTDPCRPHTNCHGKAVIRQGNTTSDTICERDGAQPQSTTKENHADTEFTTASTMKSIVFTATVLVWRSEEKYNHSTKSRSLPVTELGVSLGVSLLGVILLTTILLIRCKIFRKRDLGPFNPKVDANGNCESGEKPQINQGYVGETQLTSFVVTSPEQHCLLEKGEVCNDHSQSSNNAETYTRADTCTNHDYNSLLQSTVACDNSYCALSEPMTLISNAEPVIPQSSIPSQCSSQPTSPQIISPVTTSPHVNVNITFNIGNGSCGTPSVIPTNLTETHCDIPFGKEEESFSIPQQEDGKPSLMSVQDSASYSTCTQ